MELTTLDSKQAMVIASDVFGKQYNDALVHQAVTAFLAGGRAGTAAQKNRAAVRGGGKKPWRQKGSGRARAGTIRSPLWRTGGVIFAAQPRDYQQKMNRKAYRAAMRMIFSELLRQERLSVVEHLACTIPKTKEFLAILAEYVPNFATAKTKPRIVLVVDAIDDNLVLAARNLFYVEIRQVLQVDPVVLVNADHVIIMSAAVRSIEEWLQ